MKVICSLIFNLFLVLSCTSIDKSKDLNSNRQLVDSICNELKIKDSIQILNCKKTNSFSYFTIIDYNLNSIFHKELGEQDEIWADYQTEEYNRNIEFIYPQVKDSIKLKFPKEIQGKWYEIYQLNKDLYLYKRCEFCMIYEINDSAIVMHYMDGNYPKLLLNYEQTSINNYEFKLAEYNYDDKKVDIIDVKFTEYDSKKELYLLKFPDFCKLLVNKKDLNKFPIIFEACSDVGINPVLSFDEIKCK